MMFKIRLFLQQFCGAGGFFFAHFAQICLSNYPNWLACFYGFG